MPLLDHYYYNREWLVKRVRMVVPAWYQHAHNIRLLHSFILNEPIFAEHHTPELRKYFDSFESKWKQGMFEELTDVCLFRHVGIDSNRLDLWIRFRGSNRCENVHQKMKSCVGSWNIGVKTSHYLLLLLSFRYNISTSIKRYGKPDFFHPHISLIDRLQPRIQQTYVVLVWPKHTNILQFKPI